MYVNAITLHFMRVDGGGRCIERKDTCSPVTNRSERVRIWRVDRARSTPFTCIRIQRIERNAVRLSLCFHLCLTRGIVVQRRWWAGARRSQSVTTVAQFPRLHPHGTDTAALGCSIVIWHEVQTDTLRRRTVQTLAAAFPPGAAQLLFSSAGSDGFEKFQNIVL